MSVDRSDSGSSSVGHVANQVDSIAIFGHSYVSRLASLAPSEFAYRRREGIDGCCKIRCFGVPGAKASTIKQTQE